MKPFDKKLYIRETCHKHFNKHEIPCQPVCSKMALDPIPDQLKILKRREKVSVSKKFLLKEIAIMHEKGGFSKIKERICKQDLIYRGHLYFEPVYSHTIYKTLAYLKSHNK